MDVPVLVDQQELIYINSMQTQDVVWKTCRVRWMIGNNGERGSEKSVLSERLDDDDDDNDNDDDDDDDDDTDLIPNETAIRKSKPSKKEKNSQISRQDLIL